MDIFKPKNHGLIVLEKSTDWAAADLEYEINVPDGDWTPYLTRFENQRFGSTETMACVSFSANQICEMQIKQKTGVEVNFSDRFLAKMSGTTKDGNALSIVGDTLRHVGVVHEEEWPVPLQPFSWDNYYSEIPQFIIDRAKKQFSDKYEVHYGNVSDYSPQNLLYHLKQAPLWVTIPGHAIAGVVVNVAGNKITYFDTYEPALKTVPISRLTAVKTLVLKLKNPISMNETKIVLGKDGHTVYKCVPVATTWEEFLKQSRVEGINVPTPVPPATTL